jgi:hypothetical protein
VGFDGGTPCAVGDHRPEEQEARDQEEDRDADVEVGEQAPAE